MMDKILQIFYYKIKSSCLFMALIRLPQTYHLGFTRYKSMPLVLLILVICLGLGGWLFKGINWGVDFQGGLVVEAQLSPEKKDLNQLRKDLRSAIHREVSVQELGEQNQKGPKVILLRTDHMAQDQQALKKIKEVLGTDSVIRKSESIGPKVGLELINQGLYAIFCSLVAIMIFVWFRFEWQFSIGALAALFHDCVGLLAFFMITGLEFNETAVVAILITATYSINDTVVIFDRLRENRLQKPKLSFTQHLNDSLNETFARTLLTSSTAILALMMMCFFGGEVMAQFSLPILVGIAIGAYSSVAVAVPLMQWLPAPKVTPLPSSKPSGQDPYPGFKSSIK